ncbi:MAG: SRPBCC family protein [Flavobacteriales bacterium]
MEKKFIASVNTVIHLPIQRVWKALVDPEAIAAYMMGAQVTTDWKEDSPIVWKGEYNGRAFEDNGRVLVNREPDLLRYTHSGGTSPGEEHVVTFELKDVMGTTHLRLTQDNNATQEAAKHSEELWTTMLDVLKEWLGEAAVATPEAPRA